MVAKRKIYKGVIILKWLIKLARLYKKMKKTLRNLGLLGLLGLPSVALAGGEEDTMPAYCEGAIQVPMCSDTNDNGICDEGETRVKTPWRYVWGVMFPEETYTELFESEASLTRHKAVGQEFVNPDGRIYACTLGRAQVEAKDALVTAIQNSDVQRFDYTQADDASWTATLVNKEGDDWEGDGFYLDNIAVIDVPLSDVTRDGLTVEIPEEPVVEETPVVEEVPVEETPEEPYFPTNRQWLPSGQDTMDLGHSGARLGGELSNTSWKQTYMDSTNGTQITDIDERNGSLLFGATVPVFDLNSFALRDSMIFVSYDGELTQVGNSIEGLEHKHRVLGGFQYADPKFGIGVGAGPVYFDRTTTDVSGDLTLETQQKGWGGTLVASGRAPWAVAGYTLEHFSNLGVNVDGELEGYEDLDISAEASAEVMRHSVYAGPKFDVTDRITLVPYGEFTLTDVNITGEGSVEDSWSSENQLDAGLRARFALTDNLFLNVDADYTLAREWNTAEEALETRTGHKGARANVGLEYSW